MYFRVCFFIFCKMIRKLFLYVFIFSFIEWKAHSQSGPGKRFDLINLSWLSIHLVTKYCINVFDLFNMNENLFFCVQAYLLVYFIYNVSFFCFFHDPLKFTAELPNLFLEYLFVFKAFERMFSTIFIHQIVTKLKSKPYLDSLILIGGLLIGYIDWWGYW